MREGIELLADLYPSCFNRVYRRPLKVGVCEQVMAQHPELSRNRIKRLLKKYTQSPPYWESLKAGAARIDLNGKPAGTVTTEDEQHALIQLARMARRKAANEAEVRKTVAQAIEKLAEQRNLTPAGLKAAALKRWQLVTTGVRYGAGNELEQGAAYDPHPPAKGLLCFGTSRR
jgi:ProP effector